MTRQVKDRQDEKSALALAQEIKGQLKRGEIGRIHRVTKEAPGVARNWLPPGEREFGGVLASTHLENLHRVETRSSNCGLRIAPVLRDSWSAPDFDGLRREGSVGGFR